MTGQIVGDTEWNGLPMPRRLWAILAVTFGVALSVLDGTIANVALPTIAHELGVSSADSIWVVNAYQLVITVSLLSFASLGDIHGYRRVFLFGVAVFGVASLVCALADSLWTLVGARVVQGIGAAAVMSVNTALIRLIYPPEFLGRGMGVNARFGVGSGRSFPGRSDPFGGFVALAFCDQHSDCGDRFLYRKGFPAAKPGAGTLVSFRQDQCGGQCADFRSFDLYA